ncbi:hypothetical protein FRC18_011648 [Serendipita sp. 400]|nr:hypothetical protein FRC18_011648 [Serendipita sp. 400]
MEATTTGASSPGAPPAEPTESKKFTPLFALVIGIDDYRKVPLAGAVADAKAVRDFLTEKLGVPEINIQTLHNEEATESNITKGIRGLATNPSITRNDPILIFYAGHGSETAAPEDWESQRAKIQLIVPIDHHAKKDNSEKGCISDRTLNRLLEELAKAKGDNIIVILDCCHSGSGTRDDVRQARFIEVNEDTDSSLNDKIRGTPKNKRADVPSDVEFAGSASHVLLAACASNQSAMEDGGRGIFTEALLSTVNTHGIKNLTYTSLIKRLPDLSGQSPRCEGKNRDRLWFTTKISRDTPFYKVKQDGEDYILDAGSLQEVTKSSEFVLYKAPDILSTYLGKITVLSVDELSSVVKLGDEASEGSLPAFAIQTVFGTTKALSVYFCDNPKLDPLRGRFQCEAESSPHLYAVAKSKDAKLHVGVHEDTVTFTFANSLIRALGFDRIPFRVRLQQEEVIMRVIKAASLFIRYLNHHPDGLDVGYHQAERGCKEPVSIYYRRLERRGRNRWGENANDNEDLNKNHQVNVISGDTRYGLKITNNTQEDLYPYLLLLNCNDLTPYYTPPTVKDVDQDAPLQKGGSITVGYGDGGGQPWRHVVEPAKGGSTDKIVRDEENLQIEFFKLILTTKPVNLSFMEQPTPFRQGSRADRDLSEPVEMWKTQILPVIVRKATSPS